MHLEEKMWLSIHFRA